MIVSREFLELIAAQPEIFNQPGIVASFIKTLPFADQVSIAATFVNRIKNESQLSGQGLIEAADYARSRLYI